MTTATDNKAPQKQKPDGPALLDSERRLAYWLIAPTFLLMVAILIYPLGQVVYASLTDETFASSEPTSFVGLDTGETVFERPIEVLPREPRRYREAFQFGIFGQRWVIGATDADFIKSGWDTAIFALLAVLFETLLGLGIALALNASFKGRGGMRALMLVPWAIPTAVSSRMWEYMFSSTRTGFFNVTFQKLFGTDGNTAWLSDPTWQLPAMIAIDVWKTTPFMALLLLAGLQLISGDVYEAAVVDGASKWRQFTQITLPLLRPTLAVALVFRTLDSLRVFDLFQIVLGQSRFSMASFAYYELIDNQRMGYSSAASVVIFAILTVFAVLYIRFLGVTTDD